MSSKKSNKLFAFDENAKMSKPTKQMFTLKVLSANNIEDIAIYKTFEEAAFQSLGKYKTVKKGFVYVITNKAWKGWIKIGRAADVMDRFKHYQTFSPFRDYQLRYGKLVEDCKVLENKWKQKLKNNYKCRNEWYKINFLDAIFILEDIIKNEEKKS